MKKCKHENADHLKPGEWFEPWGGGAEAVLCEQFRCLDCEEWLPLGPSNDTSETTLEVRAAELAADEDVSKFSQREWAGWCGESDYIQLPDSAIQQFDYEHDAEWRAGYLAHDIETDGNWDGGEIERHDR